MEYSPPLQRHVKTDRGFYHPMTGGLLCPVNLDWGNTKICEKLRSGVLVPSGDQWPRFLYQSCEYNTEDPWNGLLQSGLLVSVCFVLSSSPVFSRTDLVTDSEYFYNSVVELLEDPEEQAE
ncbi:hypothetical protein FA15DRAFT_660999, partial [Coprinopsis marcescibilis]